MMRTSIACVLIISTLTIPTSTSAATAGCGRYNGRDYVVCRESGPQHMPNGLPPGTPHPGPSTATGPCGMLAATARRYGGDDLAACGRYARARYGNWAQAARHHRQTGWW